MTNGSECPGSDGRRKTRGRLALWVLGMGVGALALAALVFVEESRLLALPTLVMGLATVLLGDLARRDGYRKWMATTGGMMGICVFFLAGLYVVGGGRIRVEVARRNGTMISMARMNAAVEAFKADNGRYPDAREGLEALLAAPTGLNGTWKGPYIQGGKLPLDGWGHAFVYRMPGKANPKDFDLVSAGNDGEEGTADDIDRATKK